MGILFRVSTEYGIVTKPLYDMAILIHNRDCVMTNSQMVSAMVEAISEPEYSINNADSIHGMCHAENIIANVVNVFTVASAEERQAIRLCVNFKITCRLMGFSKRMCTLAIRTKEVSYLELSIGSLVIDDDTMDPRDVYTRLVIANDAANRISKDIRDIVVRASELATLRRRDFIHDALGDGPASRQRIEDVGFTIVETNGGPAYRMVVGY